MTRPPCALPRRLRSYPQGARIVGHPLRHPYIARIGYRLPLCLPWFWKSGDDCQSPPARKAHHRRLARLYSQRNTVGKEAYRLLAGECLAPPAKGKTSSDRLQEPGRPISRVARPSRWPMFRDHVQPLDPTSFG